MPDILYVKKHDLQPFYYAAVKDSAGNAVDLTGASILCTMKAPDGTLKIDRQSAGVVITDAVNGEFEYRWQSGDTDTPETYYIEFEVTPQAGGKFTLPAGERAVVSIEDSLDGQ